MSSRVSRVSGARASVALATFALLAACGGGGGTSYTPTAAPSSSPTPSATASSAAGPQASVASIVFTSGATQNVTVNESGYAGTFTQTNTCNPLTGTIATVSLTNANGTATVGVAPVGAGTCKVNVSDTAGHTTAISVSIAAAAITVQ